MLQCIELQRVGHDWAIEQQTMADPVVVHRNQHNVMKQRYRMLGAGALG